MRSSPEFAEFPEIDRRAAVANFSERVARELCQLPAVPGSQRIMVSFFAAHEMRYHRRPLSILGTPVVTVKHLSGWQFEFQGAPTEKAKRGKQ